MRVLVIGSGAREHALAASLARSERVDAVLTAPGNAGTARVGENVDVPVSDVEALVRLARDRDVELVVVGPEAPLAAGVVDAMTAAGVTAFGPTRAAAQLESSKAFSKDFMKRFEIPTAAYAVFDDAEAARRWVTERGRPMVVKADGLAAGKGVVVASTVAETCDAIDRIMRDRAFGSAGARVVVEEVLVGPEISFHVVSDGERYVALAPAQDHKRLLDGDGGPNTGGMGAYSPPPMVTADVEARILKEVVEPTLQGMRELGTPFSGALFVGLMIVDGAPKVLEYNVRFGDPETQVLLARWDGDLLPLLQGSARGDLSGVEARWAAPSAMAVVLASDGYPGAYPKGLPISGISNAEACDGVSVFEAGTARRDGLTVTNGGRVLSVVATGEDVDDAARAAYAGIERIHFDGVHFRRDIGWQARS